jgi:hypothetical protein
MFLLQKGAERVLWAARHGDFLHISAYPSHPLMAMDKANDPLVG